MPVVKTSTLLEKPGGEATPMAGWMGAAVSRSRPTIMRDGDSEDSRYDGRW
jgi:hypothetical protein